MKQEQEQEGVFPHSLEMLDFFMRHFSDEISINLDFQNKIERNHV